MVRQEEFPFTAEQIGSEVLERFSGDIYGPKEIIRELVKNAYDSYFELEKHLEDNLRCRVGKSHRAEVLGLL